MAFIQVKSDSFKKFKNLKSACLRGEKKAVKWLIAEISL